MVFEIVTLIGLVSIFIAFTYCDGGDPFIILRVWAYCTLFLFAVIFITMLMVAICKWVFTSLGII